MGTSIPETSEQAADRTGKSQGFNLAMANNTHPDDVKNMEYFEKKFTMQSTETVRATEDIILRESDRVIAAITTGPQDRILDKVCNTTKDTLDILLRLLVQDMYSIWKDMVRPALWSDRRC